MKDVTITIVDDRLYKSIASDICTVVAVIIPIGIGIFMSSTAMQWAGFIMASLFILGKVMSLSEKLTLEEAKRRLTEIESA